MKWRRPQKKIKKMKTTSKKNKKWRQPQQKIKNEDDLKKWRRPQKKNEDDLKKKIKKIGCDIIVN